MVYWMSYVALSLSWIFSDRLFVAPSPEIQWSLLTLGWVGLSRATLLGSSAASRLSKRAHAGLFLCTLCALVVANAPYRPGLWILSVGFLLGATSSTHRHVARIAAGALLAGTIVSIQGVIVWGYVGFTARNPDVPGAAPLLYHVLSWAGAKVGLSGGVLYVNTLHANHAFPLTWNHLAALPFLLLWGAAVGGFALRRRAFAARFVTLTLMLSGYALLRLAILVGIFLSKMLVIPHGSEVVHVNLFWDPFVTAVSFAPLVFFLQRWVPLSRDVVPAEPLAGPLAERLPVRRHRIAWTGALAAFGLVTWAHFPDPGTQKEGRVLIDESRGPWERSDRPYTTDWYGVESGYNYGCLADHVGRHYAFRRHMKGPIDAGVLDGTDVLILKTPNRSFAPEEVDAITAFVERGGGLFVLGEHSNVWGSTTFLNPVLRPFGLALRSDCVFDIERRWEQLHAPPKTGRHPVEGNIPFFFYAVSCSIDAQSWRARSVLRGKGLWTLPASYTPNNFYPEVRDHTYARFGAFDQMVAAPYGAGRVLAFSDSTTFSNFDLFDPGKSELLLGSIEWLNRRNFLHQVPFAGLVIGLLALMLVTTWVLRGRVDGSGITVFVAVGVTVGWLSLAGFDLLQQATYQPKTPKERVQRVLFEQEHSAYELPIVAFTKNFRDCYEVFYVWTQRLGAAPRVVFKYEDCLQGSDPIVIITPKKAFSAEEITRTRAWVEAGGRLLVLDHPGNEASTSRSLLESFGIRLSETPCRGVTLVNPTSLTPICDATGGNSYWRSRGLFSVKGGKPLLFTEEGEVVAAWKRHGRGGVLAVGLAEMFANPGMGGHYNQVPDAKLRAVYEVAFTLFRVVLGGDPEEQFEALERLSSGG